MMETIFLGKTSHAHWHNFKKSKVTITSDYDYDIAVMRTILIIFPTKEQAAKYFISLCSV